MELTKEEKIKPEIVTDLQAKLSSWLLENKGKIDARNAMS